MKQNEEKLEKATKKLFMLQGFLYGAIGVTCLVFDASCTDIDCKRMHHVAELVAIFALFHVIGGYISFYHSCIHTTYKPLLAYVIWSSWSGCAVAYLISCLYAYEQAWQSAALATLCGLSIVCQGCLHLWMICLHKQNVSRSEPNDLLEIDIEIY